MKTTRRTLLVGGSAALIAGPALSAASADQEKPTVLVELFTSQGCHSCPPAEAFLGELAERNNVVALEFHVDYWDYIGWKDPFADPAYTERQRRYNYLFGSPYNYTPQMVIDGRAHEVGSRRSSVESRIEAASMKREMSARDVGLPSLDARHNGEGGISIRLQGDPAEAGWYDVLVIGFDDRHETDVTRGENTGKRLHNTNVVRSMTTVHEDWQGGALALDVPGEVIKGNGGCAVLVQDPLKGTVAVVQMLATASS